MIDFTPWEPNMVFYDPSTNAVYEESLEFEMEQSFHGAPSQNIFKTPLIRDDSFPYLEPQVQLIDSIYMMMRNAQPNLKRLGPPR